MTKSRLRDLKEQIKEMSQDEIEHEKPDEIANLVETIPKFDNQNQNEEGYGLEILTLDQMLSRLPISLAQFKARNNSKNLKN